MQQTSAQKHCGSEQVFVPMPLLNTWHPVGRRVSSCLKQLHLHTLNVLRREIWARGEQNKGWLQLDCGDHSLPGELFPSVAKVMLRGSSGGAHSMSERPPLINPASRRPSLSRATHEYNFSNAKQIPFFKTPLQDCLVFYIRFTRYSF